MFSVFQFQSFCQYRAKLVKKGQNAPPNVLEDIHMLKQNNDVTKKLQFKYVYDPKQVKIGLECA